MKVDKFAKGEESLFFGSLQSVRNRKNRDVPSDPYY